MPMSVLLAFAVLAGVQVLLVVALADILTDDADAPAVEADTRRAGIAGSRLPVGRTGCPADGSEPGS